MRLDSSRHFVWNTSKCDIFNPYWQILENSSGNSNRFLENSSIFESTHPWWVDFSSSNTNWMGFRNPSPSPPVNWKFLEIFERVFQYLPIRVKHDSNITPPSYLIESDEGVYAGFGSLTCDRRDGILLESDRHLPFWI